MKYISFLLLVTKGKKSGIYQVLDNNTFFLFLQLDLILVRSSKLEFLKKIKRNYLVKRYNTDIQFDYYKKFQYLGEDENE